MSLANLLMAVRFVDMSENMHLWLDFHYEIQKARAAGVLFWVGLI